MRTSPRARARRGWTEQPRAGRADDNQDDADPSASPRAPGRFGRPGAAGRRAVGRRTHGTDIDESGAWLDARRAPAPRARHRRRGRRPGRVLPRDPLGLPSASRLVARARRSDGRRDVSGSAGDPQPGPVGGPHHRRAGDRAVAARACRRAARPRDDRARPRHQAVLPRRGDLHRVRRRAGRARRLALRLPHVAGEPSARSATSSAAWSSSAPTGGRSQLGRPVPHPS